VSETTVTLRALHSRLGEGTTEEMGLRTFPKTTKIGTMTIHAPLFSVPPCSTQKQVSEGVGQSFSPCTGAQAKQTIVFRCRRGHGNAIVVINRLQVVLDIQLSTHTRTFGTECFLRLVINPCQCDHVSPVLHQPH